MQLHLIRHGETEGNKKRLYYGITDLPVTPDGLRQLEEKGRQNCYPSVEGMRVYTTPLQRTKQTLHALYGEVDATPLPQFGEVDFGIFEMKCYEELKDDPQYQSWIAGDFMQNVPPKGESFAQFAQRILSQLDALIKAGECSLVVCHAGTISVIMMYLFPDAGKTIYDWMPSPGEGFSITLGETASYHPIPQPHWAGKGYAFYQNTQCEHFPCHKTDKPEDFNCLFCYCPLFALGENCGGNFTYTESGNKNCTGCLFPHQRGNYGKVLEKYPQIKQLARQKDND